MDLYTLVEKLEPGDHLAWQAGDISVERTQPKRVEKVEKQGDAIRVEAEGGGGGKYHFRVDPAGTNESYYHPPRRDNPSPVGAIKFAELTDSEGLVPVKRGYYDSRQKPD